MNQKQRDYTTSRIAKILSETAEFLKPFFTVKGKPLTFAEKHSLVSEGKVPVLPIYELKTYTRFEDAFDWSAFSSPELFDQEQFEVAMGPLRVAGKELQDFLQLTNDSNKSLKRLALFILRVEKAKASVQKGKFDV